MATTIAPEQYQKLDSFITEFETQNQIIKEAEPAIQTFQVTIDAENEILKGSDKDAKTAAQTRKDEALRDQQKLSSAKGKAFDEARQAYANALDQFVERTGGNNATCKSIGLNYGEINRARHAKGKMTNFDIQKAQIGKLRAWLAPLLKQIPEIPAPADTAVPNRPSTRQPGQPVAGGHGTARLTYF
ncbi:MAG: hypothetical protein EB059_04480 [Alphaproteobacteria bacterium]|nr:hypothetical protein [Alphaproteobacteria bacterium]